MSLQGSRLLFVTGRLAESGVRRTVSELAGRLGFDYRVVVPGIQVAALLHVDLLLKRLEVPSQTDRIILPGWTQGDIGRLEQKFGCVVERGPKDYRDLPEYFGQGARPRPDLSAWSIEIIAEINHATGMSVTDVVAQAQQLVQSGADLIDVGCIPGESCVQVFHIVRALVSEGLRVSIDSFDRAEVEQAVDAGAELILSCQHSNVNWISELDTEVVAIPDSPGDLPSLFDLSDRLTELNVPFRADPVLEPIGLGFTNSLARYIDYRRRYPDTAMMMGVGNVTELTEVDSAGVNMLLAAVCEELQIASVLTTQVINWCRSAVAELDVARRLVRHAVAARTPPKHIDSSLVMLRDARLRPLSDDELREIAAALTDPNFRIFASESGLHLMNRKGHWSGDSAFQVFEGALSQNQDLDASHAFYLGYELARAELCRLLGKQYSQDDTLSFGVAGTLPGSASVHHDES